MQTLQQAGGQVSPGRTGCILIAVPPLRLWANDFFSENSVPLHIKGSLLTGFSAACRTRGCPDALGSGGSAIMKMNINKIAPWECVSSRKNTSFPRRDSSFPRMSILKDHNES